MIALAAARTALLSAAWWPALGPIVDDELVPMQVLMEDERRPMLKPQVGAWALLKFGAIRAIGRDELRRTVSEDDADLLVESTYGNRALTVSCRVESISQDVEKTAGFFCERARSRLRLSSVRDVLAAAGLAVIETTPVVEVASLRDDHMESVASFDLILGLGVSETEADGENTQDTIGTVELTSDTLDDVDANPIDPQIDITATEP